MQIFPNRTAAEIAATRAAVATITEQNRQQAFRQIARMVDQLDCAEVEISDKHHKALFAVVAAACDDIENVKDWPTVRDIARKLCTAYVTGKGDTATSARAWLDNRDAVPFI